MTRFARSLALLLLLAAPTAALADPITSGASTEGLGEFTGSVDYDAGSGVLTVSLTNTSAASNGGFITAFALNDPALTSSDEAALGFGSTSGAFAAIFDPSIQPAWLGGGDSTYEFGAASTSSWLGGGSPRSGIAVGETESFSFDFSQTSLDWASYTTEDFLGNPIVVRFRGFEDGGSDKVAGNVVPEPSTWAMGFLALLILGGSRRRCS